MSERTREALLLDQIIAALRPRVKELTTYLEEHPEASLADVEQEIKRLNHGLWATALAQVMIWRRKDVEYEVLCPQCGARAEPKGSQEREQETLVGRVHWERRYYYCPSCRQGHYPLDATWEVAAGSCSVGVQEDVARLAARMSFDDAAEDLEELTGVCVSGRTVGRIAERRGTALETYLHQETQGVLEQRQEVLPYSAAPAEGEHWGVALDAGKIHLREGWHDADVGVVFRCQIQTNEAGERQVRCASPSYVAQISAMEETARRLYVESCKRGCDPVQDTVICLGDGAAVNWKQFATHFPQRVEILDWYHAMEHLWTVGHGVFGQGSERCVAWVKSQERALWEGHPEQVAQTLHALAEEEHGLAAAEAIHYFETNRARMHYDRYRAAGYPLGSGSAESGCKQVVNVRMKQAGMRWSPQGAQAILNLRAVLLAGQWKQAWPYTAPTRYPA